MGSELGIEFAVGQIDWDSGEELGVVINEIWGNGRNRSPGFGTSYYHLYDDHSGGYAELKTGRIAADIATATHNAVVGSIAMGDVDGDGMDEIVLAGLADTFPIACDSPDSIAFVIDDASNNFADLGASFLDEQSISGCEPSANNSHIEHVWVDTLDIDGDQYAEIQVNGVVYEDFKNTTAPWDPMMVDTGQGDFKIAKIPYKYIYVAETRSGQNDRSNTVLTVGDVTADGKQDILVYSPRQVKVGSVTNGNVTYDVKGWAVTIWGINPEEKAFEMQYLEELEASDSGTAAGGPPQIVAVNVDADSTILQFSEGSHKLVFSEPIVLAALAAPPCRDDGGQITDACTTAWGKGESTGSDTSSSHELSVTYFAGANLGTDVPWVGKVGVELKVSAGVSLQSESSRGYELSKTITYIAGAMEDTVIATVVPYDQYTYKIISHPVFPEAEGEDYVISLPRSPRTMQINRTFYNDSLVGDGIRIDDRVFNHIIGDVDSYPSKSDMLAKAGSVAIGPVDVGASSGSTSVEISENIVSGFTQSISVSAEVEVNVSAGQVFGGYTIGATAENSLSFSTGDSVVFSGTVGEMPPATFTLDKAYSYGMFVYTQRAGSVQTAPFQVINYWVE